MATASWPKEPKVIGKRVQKLEGPLKTSGRAKYTYDINRPGMLHAVFLPSPHAHAIVKKIDTAAAEKMPGVKGVHLVRKVGDEVAYAGSPILALAAEKEAQAYDALKAVVVEYEPLGHCVTEESAAAEGAPKVTNKDQNVNERQTDKKGDVAAAFAQAAAVVEGNYFTPAISHSCLEAHGAVAEWDGDKLTVWSSTQATQGVAQGLAREFGIDVTAVKVITHHMGGGFGSKFAPGTEGFAAAHLAKKTGKPVKLMLDRKEEHSAGVRPSSGAYVKAGADKEGKIIALESRTQAGPGVGNSGRVLIPYVYEDVPNVLSTMRLVRTNMHEVRAYRAPGHPQSAFIMEAVVDDLAAKLNMDPLQLRLKNLPGGLFGDIYRKEIEIGANLIGWKDKYHAPGKGPGGVVKRGVGMGCHKWGGRGVGGEQMLVEINPDGSVLVQSSTQDLGTSNRTVLAIVAAEVFGLRPDQINAQVGESQWAKSHGSGGSTTCPSTAPATLIAAVNAREQLFAKLAPAFEAKPEDLSCEGGKIVAKGGKSMEWKEAVRKLSSKISVMGDLPNDSNLFSVNVGGCQFAEVEVDTETGQVRCLEIVAVQDCGLIINTLACESQVAGGVIMGVNAALFEERIMDQATGRMLNPDMEFYKLASISDLPRIKVHMFDDPISQSRGVIGIGEPPTIATAGAIGNAIFNATGVRVPNAPFTPKNVLAALVKGGVA